MFFLLLPFLLFPDSRCWPIVQKTLQQLQLLCQFSENQETLNNQQKKPPGNGAAGRYDSRRKQAGRHGEQQCGAEVNTSLMSD